MMRLPAAFLAFSLGSCAALSAGPDSLSQDEDLETIEGWVLFAEGIHVWTDREAVGTYGPDYCVSGALPRAVYDRARQRLAGERVRITGRYTTPPALPTELGVQHASSFRGARFSNLCFGERVMLGETIEPAD